MFADRVGVHTTPPSGFGAANHPFVRYQEARTVASLKAVTSTQIRMSPQKSGSSSTLSELSSQLAAAVETAANSVVSIHARRRIPSSGVVWRDGVVVSASHTVRRDDDITITLASGDSVTATVAGRDAATDLVALRAKAPKTHIAT